MILRSKRHVCLISAAWILGILLAYRPESFGIRMIVLLAGFLAAVAAVNITVYDRKKEMAAVCLILAAVTIVSFFWSSFRIQEYASVQAQLKSGSVIRLTGVVYRKTQKADHYLYYLKETAYRDPGQEGTAPSVRKSGRVLLYMEDDDIPAGALLCAVGRMECFEHAANDGQFDAADWYQTQNIAFRMFPETITVISQPGFSWKESLYQVQKRISHVFRTQLNARDAGVLGAMVLGNRGMLDGEVRDSYQSAGISHILAISGLHISILGAGIFRTLRRLRFSYLFSAAAGAGVVLCYAVMSQMAVSTQRALIMYLLLTAAQVCGRTYDPVNALAAASLVILIHCPESLFQSGFLFSFLSMAAVVFLIPKGKTVKNRVLSGLILQLFLFPVTAWFYYEVPLFSLFLNLLIIPLCSWLLGFGLLGGCAGLLFPKLSGWIFLVCHFILNLYDLAVRAVNFLPFGTVITGRPGPGTVILYELILIVLCMLIRYRDKVRSSLGRIAAAAAFLVLFTAILHPQADPFCITFLDVGQGDGICISDGGGRHVMIDGGSSGEKELGKYTLEPFLKYHGVRRIDAWILTHGDYDHYSGLLELLQDQFPVRCLLLAEAMPHDSAWVQLTEAAAANNTRVVYVRAGNRIALKNSQMSCLYPGGNDWGEDANALSQTWLFQTQGLSVLFTGDIGQEQEERMLERGLIPDLDILKAAHHGSKYSSCPAFLETAQPEYTVLSCGEGNRYGHPHKETLERLEEAGSKIERTDRMGAISVRMRKEGFQIESYAEKKHARRR